MDQNTRLSRKTTWVVGAVCGTVLAAAGIGYWKYSSPQQPAPEKSSVEVSLSPPSFVRDPDGRPDALIVTQSLSRLPRDILQQPLLKNLLTEDFVFYYQDTEGYLSLKGALKRIAFEHELTVFDQLLSRVMNTPAEVALWKSYDGKLDDYMLVLKRGVVTDLMTAAAKVAADDRQLSLHEERSEAGESFKVYKVRYAYGKDLYFTALEDRLLIFTHPQMPIPIAERVKKWGGTLVKEKPSTYTSLFGRLSENGKHSLYFSARFLSFGYQRFFPAVDALRFQFSDQGSWSTHTMISGQATPAEFDSGPLWQAVPKSPSLCAALPVHTGNVHELTSRVFRERDNELKQLFAKVQAPVAICWYPESKLYTPVILARLSGETPGDDQIRLLRELFDQSIGNLEAGILTKEEEKLYREQREKIAAGEKIDEPVRAKKFKPAIPTVETRKEEGVIWSREVSSRYGIHKSEKSRHREDMRSSKYFNVRMALWKNHLVFSADDRLVDSAIAVLDKKYPALADVLGKEQRSGVVIYPSGLSDLIRQSILESLPSAQESVFRESVSRRLFPALDRMKNVSALALVWPETLPAAGENWKEVKWRELPGK